MNTYSRVYNSLHDIRVDAFGIRSVLEFFLSREDRVLQPVQELILTTPEDVSVRAMVSRTTRRTYKPTMGAWHACCNEK